MKKWRVSWFLLMLVSPLTGLQAGVKTGQDAPDFQLLDVDGQKHSLSDYRDKYVVLEWTNCQCPFVEKHYDSGNMQSLQRKFTAEGVAWLSIVSSGPGKQGFLSPDEARALIVEKAAHPTAYLFDPDGSAGHLYGAKTTPHIYIVDPQGKLIYQGAIDSIRSTAVEDIDKAVNYISLALNEAQAGKPISHPVTKAYGCSIKYAK